jgi:hypothetical protein
MPDELLNSIEAPKDLMKAMQDPLVTRWWTMGSLAILTTKHLDFFSLLSRGVCNMTNSDQKDNIIASNLLSLASSEWILASVFFVAGIAKCWLNHPHEVVPRELTQTLADRGSPPFIEQFGTYS